ncbi:MAG TPA: 50S ribosomal protein L24 [Candidatus Paceibacterota bacterium]|jgi:large subunit ribosomal protein L24|nr:50S ribosomal protein L24 [Candidatus Paceibacterota bacterium]HPQ22812.1 50S ribosomal protein L24 [Candidatus Paceibacterota bacterium]HRR45559.1 50S ribosomal protein L24 [Candidatus Paceibacterota bacterium]
MKIRKGDNVIIIKGKDRKKTGRVLRVLPKENKVIIENLNLVKKIKKPKKEGEKGEIISIPRAIDCSNVMLVCPSCQKSTRIGIAFEDGKKYRVCKKCQKKIGEIK